MKTYRRILVPIFNNRESEDLLHAVKNVAVGHRPQVLIVRLLDPKSGFESDGPAGQLPGEIAARRVPEAMRRLDLQLARHNLAWVETRSIWRNPEAELAELIRSWHPDLVVVRRGHAAQGIPEDIDLLHAASRGFLRQFADAFMMPVPGAT